MPIENIIIVQSVPKLP